ncbi:MAG: hypothetical protein L6Q71_07670 [Planctomycetes bacterium]|nr:hypothetical protein [Planctomycetota bacterium]NUQ33980.1 hypothetical protein [Planctomycetaceae bacterium]
MKLNKSVWSDAEVAKKFQSLFIPVRVESRQLYAKPHADVLAVWEKYFTYIVIFDAEKQVLARFKNAPFETSSEALSWMDKVCDSIKTAGELASKRAAQPDGVETHTKLADAYYDLGLTERAQELYEGAIPKLSKQEAITPRIRVALMSIEMEITDILGRVKKGERLNGHFSDNMKSRAPFIGLYEELLKAKDERAYTLLLDRGRPWSGLLFKSIGDEVDFCGRALAAMPDHRDANKLRFACAEGAIMVWGGDEKDATRGKSLLEDIVKTGRKDDPEYSKAQEMLEKYDEIRGQLALPWGVEAPKAPQPAQPDEESDGGEGPGEER